MAACFHKIKNIRVMTYLPLIATSLLIITASDIEAVNSARRDTPVELFRKAAAAAEAYHFDEAADLLEQYSNAIPRRGKAPVSEEEFEALTGRVERGQLMMDRVEKIIVIDSITVPKTDFFSAYRLDSSAGTLCDITVLPPGVPALSGQPVFIPESGQTMMWSMPDSTGRGVITELSLLADGSYEPLMMHPELNVESDGEKVNALFPFLMSDGITLYYAMDNPELSLGGLDIFFTRRDGTEFMQPQNVGMPYNSPANDYMLAIDEITGTGWWATDRNAPDSASVTIYRFIPNELRVNYNDSDVEDIAPYARLDSWRATQPAGADYSELLSKPREGKGGSSIPEIRISIPGRGIVTAIKDLKSANARRLANDYIAALNSLQSAEQRLADMRRDYASGNRINSTEIISLERQIPQLRSSAVGIRNEIIKAEL